MGAVFVAGLLAAAAYFVALPRVRQEVRERRPLPNGECTWYASERAKDDGWRIRFDVPYNRHARNWPEKVQNAVLSITPTPGAVMVLDAWPGNPYGHVGYVESVTDRDRWVITHANFAVGEAAGSRDGVAVYRAVCTRTRKGVTLGDLPKPFDLRGFLSPATEGAGR